MSRRKALFFSSRDFTREVKVPPVSSDLGKGQRRERGPHSHDTVYLIFRRTVPPRSRLGQGGRECQSAAPAVKDPDRVADPSTLRRWFRSLDSSVPPFFYLRWTMLTISAWLSRA